MQIGNANLVLHPVLARLQSAAAENGEGRQTREQPPATASGQVIRRVDAALLETAGRGQGKTRDQGYVLLHAMNNSSSYYQRQAIATYQEHARTPHPGEHQVELVGIDVYV